MPQPCGTDFAFASLSSKLPFVNYPNGLSLARARTAQELFGVLPSRCRRSLERCWKAHQALTILEKHAKLLVDLVRVFLVVSNVTNPPVFSALGKPYPFDRCFDTRSSNRSMVWGFTCCGQHLPATARRRHRAEGTTARLPKAQAIRLSVLES